MSRFNNGARDFDMNRLTLHPFYPIWNAMVQRCTNPKYKGYENYGAIGITLCDEWMPPKESGFLTFLRDMVDPHLLPGEDYFQPYFSLGKSLDRRFGPAGYNPENCRWVTPEVQNLNRRGGRSGRLYPQGVKWDKRANRFYAYYIVEGKTVPLVSTGNLFEAIARRRSWELARYKELGVES
jgi:hypothetical protein